MFLGSYLLCLCVVGALAGNIYPSSLNKAQNSHRNSATGSSTNGLDNQEIAKSASQSTAEKQSASSDYAQNSANRDRGASNAAQSRQKASSSGFSQQASAGNVTSQSDVQDNSWTAQRKFNNANSSNDGINYAYDKKFELNDNQDGAYVFSQDSDSKALDSVYGSSSGYDRDVDQYSASASSNDKKSNGRDSDDKQNYGANQASWDNFGRDAANSNQLWTNQEAFYNKQDSSKEGKNQEEVTKHSASDLSKAEHLQDKGLKKNNFADNLLGSGTGFGGSLPYNTGANSYGPGINYGPSLPSQNGQNFGTFAGPSQKYGNLGNSFQNNNFEDPRQNYGNLGGPSQNFGNPAASWQSDGKLTETPTYSNFAGPRKNFGDHAGPSRIYGNLAGASYNYGNLAGPSQNFGSLAGPFQNSGNLVGSRNFDGLAGPSQQYGGLADYLENYGDVRGGLQNAVAHDYDKKNQIENHGTKEQRGYDANDFNQDVWNEDFYQAFANDRNDAFKDQGISDKRGQAAQNANKFAADSEAAQNSAKTDLNTANFNEDALLRENVQKALKDHNDNNKVFQQYYNNDNNNGSVWERMKYNKDQDSNVKGADQRLLTENAFQDSNQASKRAGELNGKRAGTASAKEAGAQKQFRDWQNSATGEQNERAASGDRATATKKESDGRHYKDDKQQNQVATGHGNNVFNNINNQGIGYLGGNGLGGGVGGYGYGYPSSGGSNGLFGGYSADGNDASFNYGGAFPGKQW